MTVASATYDNHVQAAFRALRASLKDVVDIVKGMEVPPWYGLVEEQFERRAAKQEHRAPEKNATVPTLKATVPSLRVTSAKPSVPRPHRQHHLPSRTAP